MITVKDSVLTDPEEIQDRVNAFVTFVNQCLEENLRKEKQEDKTA